MFKKGKMLKNCADVRILFFEINCCGVNFSNVFKQFCFAEKLEMFTLLREVLFKESIVSPYEDMLFVHRMEEICKYF